MGWNIYYDLNKSSLEAEYKRFKFIFSSNFYLNKFKKEIDEYVSIEKQKMYLKFRTFLESDEFLALSLYKKIEKRGFKAYFSGREIKPESTFTISLSYLDNI